MLVLAVKTGESVMIGENIRVQLVEVCNGRARIGIEAPREIPVHREEIFRLIQAANKAAGSDRAARRVLGWLGLPTRWRRVRR